jgi:AraC-like DNA-binding protein
MQGLLTWSGNGEGAMPLKNSIPLPPVRADEAERLEVAMAYLKKHFVSVPPRADLAKLAGMSRFYFYRSFRRHFGTTPKAVEISLRIELAKRLLRDGVPLADVVAPCGFNSHPHLCLRFKLVTGQTPTEWRVGASRATAMTSKQKSK